MRTCFLFLWLTVVFDCIFAQIPLSSIEGAYLFHSVKKSPILDRHLGAYFEYSGEKTTLPNGKIDYDSIERNMIADPTLLHIDTQQIAKSPRGIVAELANKLALWELNKMLHARQTKDTIFETFADLYQQFEKLVTATLPPIALKNDTQIPTIHPRIYSILNPNLSIDEKIAQLNAIRNISPNDELQIITAIDQSVHHYIEQRTRLIFESLGGKYSTMYNLITAAGEGKNSISAIDNRQKDEKGFWNKGLPQAIGLFGYQMQLLQADHPQKKPTIETSLYTTTDWETVGNHQLTKIHFDVWGYHPENQVMVVLEKHGKSYPLFSSGETRFLSPDSTFSNKRTFQRIIDELEKVKIGNLTEKIDGKDGFDAQINYHREQKDARELQILKSEKKFSDMGYATITTSEKASRKAKKSKKQAVLRGVGADNWDATPTTKSKKKQKGKTQNTIIDLYQQFEWHQIKIKELEKEKQLAIDLRARYQLQLDQYMLIRGLNWMPYTEKNGIYTFSDSCTFNVYTQDFHFPASKKQESFELRTIAIPDSALALHAHQIMLHATLLDAHPYEDARIKASFLQKANPKQLSSIDRLLFKTSDSIEIRSFFNALMETEHDMTIHATGQGIGVWNGVQVIKYVQTIETDDYQEIDRLDTQQIHSNLWWTDILIHLNNPITLTVNSFINEWDALPNLAKNNKKLVVLQNKYNLSDQELLTAQRSAHVLKKIRDELYALAGRYLSIEDTKTVVARIEKAYKTTKIQIGDTQIDWKSFLTDD